MQDYGGIYLSCVWMVSGLWRAFIQSHGEKIWGSVSRPRTLQHVDRRSWGSNCTALWLVDNPLNLLSNNCPFVYTVKYAERLDYIILYVTINTFNAGYLTIKYSFSYHLLTLYKKVPYYSDIL